MIFYDKESSALSGGGMSAKPALPGISLRNGFRFRQGQEDFLLKLADAYRQGQLFQLGVFVPGYGKTITALASFVVARALGIAKKLVVFVPRGNLRDQYANAKELGSVLEGLGAPPLSYCVADSERAFVKNLQTDIIITTYQYASGRGGHKALKQYCAAAPCMFVFDEVHHLSEEGTWAIKIGEFPYSCSVALSGTPMRSDNKSLFGVPLEIRNGNEQYYVALHEVFLRDAHAEGKILKHVAVHVIDYNITMQNLENGQIVEMPLSQMVELAKTKNELDAFLARKKLRFHEVYLDSLLRPAFERFAEKRKQLTQERVAAGDYSANHRQHQLLVIAMSNLHAQAMLEFIREKFPHFVSARIGQDVPDAERALYLEKYREGEIDVMVQVDMIGEGTDIKPISVIVKADLVRAFSKTLQQIFRGMRYFNGFSEEANVCDIYTANDSDVVHILEWIASEEQLGITLKQQREEREKFTRTQEEQPELWHLMGVDHSAIATHSLELFPGFARPTTPVVQKKQKEEEKKSGGVINVAAREQELRQECSALAARLAFILKSNGMELEISRIHAVSKRKFVKPQEQMSIPELNKKREWLLECIARKKVLA